MLNHEVVVMFQKIFDVFSARAEAATKKHNVPQTTRTRILMWVSEIYRGSRAGEFGVYSNGDFTVEFWEEISRRILFRTGGVGITQETSWSAGPRGIMKYVSTCDGEQFLDFLEDIFSNDYLWRISSEDAKIVDELNALLRVDNLPYCLTHFVRETVSEGSSYTIHTRAYPKVILKESEALHENAIAPALVLLQRPHFRGANAEYRAALEDYRKGEVQDCLTKCGSAFESALKVICERKGWTFNQTDAAKRLLDIVLPNTSLDSYFEPLLIIIATLRNRLSSAHGTGTAVRDPAPHIAQYALNITASAILLIAQETGEQ